MVKNPELSVSQKFSGGISVDYEEEGNVCITVMGYHKERQYILSEDLLKQSSNFRKILTLFRVVSLDGVWIEYWIY
jgi:hypothetical protein